MSIAPVDWSDAAACRGSEGALFFSPEVSEKKEDRHEREFLAKRICANCPVRMECLEAALRARDLRHLGWAQRTRTSSATAYVTRPNRVGRDTMVMMMSRMKVTTCTPVQ